MACRAITERSRLVVAADQVSCDLAGEVAILNLKSGIYFGLDPVGASVWNSLQKPVTLAELCDRMVEEYDVERARLEADLRDLICDLAEHGLIEISE